jgi:hypothetical protein
MSALNVCPVPGGFSTAAPLSQPVCRSAARRTSDAPWVSPTTNEAASISQASRTAVEAAGILVDDVEIRVERIGRSLPQVAADQQASVATESPEEAFVGGSSSSTSIGAIPAGACTNVGPADCESRRYATSRPFSNGGSTPTRSGKNVRTRRGSRAVLGPVARRARSRPTVHPRAPVGRSVGPPPCHPSRSRAANDRCGPPRSRRGRRTPR